MSSRYNYQTPDLSVQLIPVASRVAQAQLPRQSRPLRESCYQAADDTITNTQNSIFPSSATSESSSLPTITTSISPTTQGTLHGAVSIGAVAGGAIGGLLFVSIAALIFYFCRRRSRGNEVDESIPANNLLSPHPQLLSPIHSDFRENDANLPSSSDIYTRRTQPMNRASASAIDGLGHIKDRELQLRPTSIPSNEQQDIAGVNPWQQQESAQVLSYGPPRLAQDSGVRFDGDRAVYLPPLYTER